MASLTTYSDLLRILPQLAPPPGKALVFRGQSERRPALLATGLRSAEPYEAPWIWFAYSILLARRFKLIEGLRAEMAGKIARASDAIGNEELFFMFAVGMDAFAQHYGPGSRFLDVTRSLDVALWFGLHRPVANDLVAVPQNPAELLRDPERMTIHQRVSYTPAPEGWLYAFHVPEFDPEQGLAQGVLVDLMAKGVPTFFQTSTRLHTQSACLLFGGEGDLSPYLACDPIAIARPLAGAPQLDAALETVFPGPDRDPWYALMLSIPPSPLYEPKTRSLQLRQPIQVHIYAEQSNDAAVPFVQRMRRLRPIDLDERLVFDATAMPPDWANDVRGFFAAQRPHTAPMLVLDAPVMRFHAPLEQWCQDQLFTGLTSEAPVYDPANGQHLGALGLSNVLIEISPLEYTFWDTGRYEPNEEPARAIWLARAGDYYAMFSMFDPIEGTKLTLKGPLFARFNRTFNRAETYVRGTWTSMTSQDPLTAALLTAADLLRNISPGRKPNALPNALGIGNVESPNGLSEDAYELRLDAVRSPDGGSYHFLVRNVHTNGPYIPLQLIRTPRE
jgi:hypothetical protein